MNPLTIAVQLALPWETPIIYFENLDQELGAYATLLTWGYYGAFPGYRARKLDPLFITVRDSNLPYQLELRSMFPSTTSPPETLYFESPDFLRGVTLMSVLAGLDPQKVIVNPHRQSDGSSLTIPQIDPIVPTTSENDPREWIIPPFDAPFKLPFSLDFPDRRLSLNITPLAGSGLVLGLDDAGAQQINLYREGFGVNVPELAKKEREFRTLPTDGYHLQSVPHNYWFENLDFVQGYLTGLRSVQSVWETTLRLWDPQGNRLELHEIDSLVPGLPPNRAVIEEIERENFP